MRRGPPEYDQQNTMAFTVGLAESEVAARTLQTREITGQVTLRHPCGKELVIGGICFPVESLGFDKLHKRNVFKQHNTRMPAEKGFTSSLFEHSELGNGFDDMNTPYHGFKILVGTMPL